MVSGLHRGVVSRVDGERVRLRVPAVLGGEETPWADPLSEGTAPPEVGTVVWVFFEDGDPSRPVWTSGVGGGGGGQDVIYHGADATVERPESAASSVVWIGTVEPSNAIEDDLWYDTDAVVNDLTQHVHGTADIVDGAITLAKMAFDTATQAELDAVDTAKVAKSGDVMTGPLLLPDGSAAAPSAAFASDPDTGLFSAGDGFLSLAAGGARRAYLATGGFYPDTDDAMQLGAPLKRWNSAYIVVAEVNEVHADDGAASNPSYGFKNDPDTGFYRPGPKQLAASLDGVSALHWEYYSQSNVGYIDIPLPHSGIWQIHFKCDHSSNNSSTHLQVMYGGTLYNGASDYSVIRQAWRSDGTTLHYNTNARADVPMLPWSTTRGSDDNFGTVTIDNRAGEPEIFWQGYSTPETSPYGEMAVLSIGAAQANGAAGCTAVRIFPSSGSFDFIELQTAKVSF